MMSVLGAVRATGTDGQAKGVNTANTRTDSGTYRSLGHRVNFGFWEYLAYTGTPADQHLISSMAAGNVGGACSRAP